MEEEIPNEIQLRYLKHPYFCPYCESDKIGIVNNPEPSESDFVTQTMGCMDCDNVWLEVYQLSGIEPYPD